MVDRRKPVDLSLWLAVVSVPVLCVVFIMIASCATPTVDAPQTVSPTPLNDSTVEVVPTPTDAAVATSPVQREAAALLGRWASDEDLVLELGSNGVFTLSHGIDQLDTGTWSLQNDGSFALEGQPYHVVRQKDGSFAPEGQAYVAVPQGNLLLLYLDETGRGEMADILQRVGGDGKLVAYEPSNLVELPPMESAAILTIEIADNWTGLSPLAPIQAHFHLEPTMDRFSGMADFSVAGYTGAITRSVPISVPLVVIEDFLALLESTPLEVGEYRPLFSHTDDYPSISIAVEGEAVDFRFYSESQGSRHIPWRVVVGQDRYVTYADTAAEALDLLDPYLAREVQEALFDLASARPVD